MGCDSLYGVSARLFVRDSRPWLYEAMVILGLYVMVAYFISIQTHTEQMAEGLECQAKGFLLLKTSKSHACCFPHTHVV